jgi:hypothetical protein
VRTEIDRNSTTFCAGLHEQDDIIIVIDAAADVGVKIQIHSLLSSSLDRLANASV